MLILTLFNFLAVCFLLTAYYIKRTQPLPKVIYQGIEPNRANPTDSGWDIRTAHHYTLAAGETMRIKTGTRLQLPAGYEVQIRPKSGLNSKGIIARFESVAVQLGTVDNSYTNEIEVVVTNGSPQPYTFQNGVKIAQLVFARVIDVQMVNGNVSQSKRGGFGSTGEV